MEKQLHTWRFLLSSLQLHIPVMLLYVLESKGSSPGRQGFFMAVNARGAIQGSIGGGIMEHKFAEMAKDRLQHAATGQLLRRQIHNKEAGADQSGMICSGEQTVWLYPVPASAIHIIHSVIRCLEEHRNATLQLSPGGLMYTDDTPPQDFSYRYQENDDWLYEEKLGLKNRVQIIGAGHCALALSRILRIMDFYICLYDDRAALNTFEENGYAHEKKLLGNYTELSGMMPESEYVVVMTMGYRTDDLVIRTLMDKRFLYLGVLGSKKKLEKMFAAYKTEGISETLLAAIHAPAGLPVNSQTPEEIAVSIAAEIIGVRNKAL